MRIFTHPHRLRNVEEINHQRVKKSGDIVENRVIFVPTMMRGNYRRLDTHYPDTWYYRFSKALVDYLATRDDYEFVWKGLPSSDGDYNPIPDYIKDRGFRNIEVAFNRLVEHLPTAGRVILDFPSTGFYEAVVAGVPAMSLYYRGHSVRETALELFGRMLKPFGDVEEAIEQIEEFLNSDPKLYEGTIESGDISDPSMMPLF